MRNTGKILLGLVGMFAAGAIIGTLYAPDKGERTRRKLARKGKHLIYSTDDALEEGKGALEEIRDRLKESLEQVKDEMNRLSH